MDDTLNVPLDFLPLSLRNPHAEDRVRRPRAPLPDLRPSAHLPPGADPPGQRAGAHDKVLDGVAAEGGTPDRLTWIRIRLKCYFWVLAVHTLHVLILRGHSSLTKPNNAARIHFSLSRRVEVKCFVWL